MTAPTPVLGTENSKGPLSPVRFWKKIERQIVENSPKIEKETKKVASENRKKKLKGP